MNLIRIFILVAVTYCSTLNLVFAQTTKASESNKTILVKVKNVGCADDLKMICDNVEKLEGVGSCIVEKQGATTKLQVNLNPSLVTEDAVQVAIENTGTCEDPNDRRYKVKL